MAPNNTITLPNAASTRLFLEKSLSKRAYVTLLAGNGDDCMGVQGLAMGLKKVKSRYPLVVAILPDVPEEHRTILQDLGCILKEIRPVYQLKKYAELASEFPFVTKYSKLLLWQLEEYSKMIYLEGDMLVLKNIDLLFDFPDGYIHAPLGCFCPEAWSHPLYEQCPDSSKWPTELGPKPSSYYRASMFVFEPSTSILDDLFNTLKSIVPSQPIPSAEQHVLNKCFRERLSAFPGYIYRALTMVDEEKEIDHLEKVRVIRYSSPGLRPWRHSPKMGNVDFVNKLKRKWEDICPGRSLDSEELKSVKTENLQNFPSASGTK